MPNSYPAACRLRNDEDIKAVFASRDISKGRRLVFYRARTTAEQKGASEENHRFCLVVSKKCGHAVRRNRIKRLLREIIRNNRFRIETGFDYIIRVTDAKTPGGHIKQEAFFDDFKSYFGWS